MSAIVKAVEKGDRQGKKVASYVLEASRRYRVQGRPLTVAGTDKGLAFARWRCRLISPQIPGQELEPG